MSPRFPYCSISTVSKTRLDTLLEMLVFPAIFKDLMALEKKRFNFSAISASSFKIYFFSIRYFHYGRLYLGKRVLFMKRSFITSQKVLVLVKTDGFRPSKNFFLFFLKNFFQ